MKSVNLKDKIDFAGHTWNVFKITADGDAYVLMNDSLKISEFGSSNNYKRSDIRMDLLNGSLLYNIKKELGEGALVPIRMSLTSLDGLKDYGKIEDDELGILNLDLYRENRENIPLINEKFWLATPDSTPSGVGSDCVLYVDSNGGVGYTCCDWYYGGVRPFCILES